MRHSTLLSFGLTVLWVLGCEKPAAEPPTAAASDGPPKVADADEDTQGSSDLEADSESDDPEEDVDLEEQLALQAFKQRLGNETSHEEKLRLFVFERGPDQPWVMGVVNDSMETTTLVADPRLLRFTVSVPGNKKDVSCKLPSSLFPKRASERYQATLGNGEGVVKAFDPRLYCFASEGQTVLVPGAIVKASFGWPKAKKTVWKRGKRVEVHITQEPPFVAKAVEPRSQQGEAATKRRSSPSANDGLPEQEVEALPFKELTAAPFSLGSVYADWAKAALAKPTPNDSPIVVEMRQGSDASTELDATLAVTLKNKDKRTRYVYFRRELLSFEIFGPSGSRHCDPEPDERAPDPQAFLRLTPNRSMTITSRLVELCPKGTFGQPGFYLVHARFDARHSGEEFGIDGYVGRVATSRPANLRIRNGELTESQKHPMRPLLIRE